MSASATGVPTPTYQWSKNGTPISSAVNSTATNATFNIASASPTDTASYSVTISNPAGITNSVAVMLTVNSTMAATSLLPTNGATRVCYDTPLYITFNATPVLRLAGAVKIYNVTNAATPVDTINLALGSPQARTFNGDAQGFSLYPVIITSNTAAIYPHSGVMTNKQTYYVTMDDGVFAEHQRRLFRRALRQRMSGNSRPSQPAEGQSNQFRGRAGIYSGDFATVQGAVDSVPAGQHYAEALINR